MKEQNIQQETNFGVIGEFVTNTEESIAFRSIVQSLIDSDQDEALLGMGFPKECIPIIKLWREYGPNILTSFSHPEEFDMDKMVGLINLGLYSSYVSNRQVDSTQVLIVDYDTIPIQKSVKKPFKASTFGIDIDMFGVRNDRISAFVLTNERRMDIYQRINSLDASGKGTPVELLLNQLRQELAEEMKGTIEPERKKYATECVENILVERFGQIRQIAQQALDQAPQTLGQTLAAFDQLFTNYILDLGPTSIPFSGFRRTLFSDNQDFLELVRNTIQILIASRGVQILRDIINPGEGICAIHTENDRHILSKDESEGFILKSDLNSIQISDEDAKQFALSGIPLAKMESAALFAGAQTLHIGSEYGVRPKILNALGFKGKAFEYVMGLKVAEDKKHGNLGMVMKEGGYVPSLFAFILLGKTQMKQLLLSQAGRTNTPLEFSVPELKKFAAQNLITETVSRGN